MNDSLPAVGSLVKIVVSKNICKKGVKNIQIADLNGELEVYALCGTIALVVGEHTRGWRPLEKVPLVMVDNFVGWIFNDEWEVIDDS